MLSASSGGSSPSTLDQLTPAFSNTAPPSSTLATPPPPPGRCQASEPNPVLPSTSASDVQMSDCSSWKNFAARSKRSDTLGMLPFGSVPRRMWAALRLLRALRVFAVIFLSYMWQVSWARLWPAVYDTRERWKKINRRNARRMYKGFVRLRGVYIKLGQILSVMGTFLPREYTEELEGLQDDVPPQSYKKIKGTFVKSFKKQPHECFTTFTEEPIAAASLGQVHEATTPTGERLAVKILYP